MREIELDLVEAWTCPDCGKRNYVEPDDLDVDDDTGVVGLAEVVECGCGGVFDVAEWDDELDDDDDDGTGEFPDDDAVDLVTA